MITLGETNHIRIETRQVTLISKHERHIMVHSRIVYPSTSQKQIQIGKNTQGAL
jgi:GTPase Era involved in 16S rRNA processing